MSQKIYVLSKIENGKKFPHKIYENKKRATWMFHLHSIFQKGKWFLKEVTIPKSASVVYIKRRKKKVYDKEVRLESYHVKPIKYPTYTKKVIKDNPLRVLLFQPLSVLIMLLLTIAFFADHFRLVQVINICSIAVICLFIGVLIGEMIYLMRHTDFVEHSN